MLNGFQSVLPAGGDIVISQEASTYRPEMEWIAARLNDRQPHLQWRVTPAEHYEPQNGRAVYRFFELFDLPNIPNIKKTLRAASEGQITITPPIKPYLEEKMWFALFWLQPLRQFWRRELGELYLMRGRVRLCPYFFVEAGRVQMRGALATIVPADKKLLHGMSDAILVPTSSERSPR